MSYKLNSKYNKYLAKIIKNCQNIDGSLMVGGGLAYDSVKYEFDKVRDLDLMFFFRDSISLKEFLFNNDSNTIAGYFGFDEFTYDFFSKEDIDFIIKHNIEVIRFSGRINGIKATVKLTSLEVFNKAVNLDKRVLVKDSFIRVYSKNKDKRIYKDKSSDGRSINRFLINKTVEASSQQEKSFVILDVGFHSLHGKHFATGLFSDCFLTGLIIKDFKNQELFKIQTEFRRIFSSSLEKAGSKIDNWKDFFIRGERFSEEYSKYIIEELEKVDSRKFTGNISNKPDYSSQEYCVLVDPSLFDEVSKPFQFEEIDYKPVRLKDEAISSELHNFLQSRGEGLDYWKYSDTNTYSSNCHAGYLYDNDGEKYFFKVQKEGNLENVASEFSVHSLVSKFYKYIQNPLFVSPESQMIVYNWLDHRLLADYYRNENIEDYIRIELQRSEELLCAYLSSFQEVSSMTNKQSRIHKLFFNRLKERYSKYYKDSNVKIDDLNLTWEKFSKLRPIINGVQYNSIHEILDLSFKYLSPDFLEDKVKIVGLGDPHAGNVLVLEDGSYVNIDYEFGGIHHPSLDLSKTLYNDIYPDILFSEDWGTNENAEINVEYNYNNDKLRINHNYQVSELGKSLISIKIKGILEPLLLSAKNKNININDWEMILRSALFACAILNKNILKYSYKNFLLAYSLAVGLGSINKRYVNNQGHHDKGPEYFNAILEKTVDNLANKSR